MEIPLAHCVRDGMVCQIQKKRKMKNRPTYTLYRGYLFLNDEATNDDEKSGQKQVPAATKFIKKLNVVRTMPDRRRS